MFRTPLLGAIVLALIAGPPSAPASAAASHAATLAPVYTASQGWLNGRLTPADAAGKVVIDNSFAIWNAYGVGAWPTQLLFDRTGTLRATIVGDSQDETVDRIVQKLLAER